MEEKIVIFQEDAVDVPVYIGRKEFHENRQKYSDYYLYVIDVFIFNSHGELLLQKRSRNKSINPLKLHTSVGGHVNPGEAPQFTILHECLEEIGAPCYLATDQESFAAGLPLVKQYTNNFVYVCPQKEMLRNVSRETPLGHIAFKDKSCVFFGIYNGPVHNIDRSAAGFEHMSLAHLEEEMEKNPSLFTGGLYTYVQDLRDDLYSFVEKYCRG